MRALLRAIHKPPGLKRWVPSLIKRYAKAFWPNGYTLKFSRNCLFLLNYSNYVDRQITFYDNYETTQLTYFLALVKTHSAEIFVDVGANFGYYSAIAAYTFPTLEIHAFEPDDRNHAQCMATLLLNDCLHRVQVHPEAVSDRVGWANFEAAAASFTGKSRLAEEYTTKQVRCVKLDEFLVFRERRIALKMDIEGHELVALAGMKEMLARNSCVIQVESFSGNDTKLRQFMEDLGYRWLHKIEFDHYFSNAACHTTRQSPGWVGTGRDL